MNEDKLTAADRTTLGAWRVGNLVGWSLGALIVGIAMDFVANFLVDDLLDAAIDPVTGGAVVSDWAGAVLRGALVGIPMGAVIGSRVYRWPTATAVVVTVVYLGLWPFALLTAGRALMLGVIIHLLLAATAARIMFRRRRLPSPTTPTPAATITSH